MLSIMFIAVVLKCETLQQDKYFLFSREQISSQILEYLIIIQLIIWFDFIC